MVLGKRTSVERHAMPKPKRPHHQLGRNLAAARQSKNWTQERAAESAGVSLKYWQALEGGQKAPAFTTLCTIRASLDVDWNSLCDEC